MDAIVACDDGYNCVDTGVIFPRECIYGQYEDNFACVACLEDKYCEEMKATVPVACESGYKCHTGAPHKLPAYTKAQSNDYHLCEEGYYCDAADFGGLGVSQ